MNSSTVPTKSLTCFGVGGDIDDEMVKEEGGGGKKKKIKLLSETTTIGRKWGIQFENNKKSLSIVHPWYCSTEAMTLL